MAIETHVVFETKLTEEQHSAINAQAQIYEQAGTTDGVISYDPPEPPGQEPGVVIIRTWTTTAAAEEWITFIETFSPYSAQIVNT
jgi:hypothetical protein